MGAEAFSIIGGSAGVFAFIAAMIKIFSADRIWKDLIQEVRDELRGCREDKGKLEAKVDTLEGEVMQLRREVNVDRWLGIDPQTRPLKSNQHGPTDLQE